MNGNTSVSLRSGTMYTVNEMFATVVRHLAEAAAEGRLAVFKVDEAHRVAVRPDTVDHVWEVNRRRAVEFEVV